MGRQPVGEPGASVSRAALSDLLKRLRRAAVHGVVPEHEFLRSTRALALGDGERDRLRNELARLGLPVRDLHTHADFDSRDGEKVAYVGEENVSARVAVAQTLLSRYGDPAGYVTSRALEGVIRLAGLDAREAAELRARARVRRDPDSAEGREPDGAKAARESHEATVATAPDKVEAAKGDDLADAVAAAMAVLEADRFERRPGKQLLSAEAEVGLAVLLRGGVDRVAQEPDEEELKALPRGDIRIRARDCLVVHNQGLVHSLVRTALDQGLEYEDLFQHGMLGLMRAARKFDPTMGNKFSTYATWWVRQALTRAIADEGALIRIPVHMHEQIRKVANAERALAAQGRPATAADVAVACDLSLEKVEQARKLSRRTDSLDRIIGDGATLADFVGETRPLPSVEKQALDALHAAEVMAVVNTFSGRDHRILVRRLGLDGDEPSTLDELGREIGVSREWVRQLEVKLRPELRKRLRVAGLFEVDLDAECEKAEQAAERATQAARAARIARAARVARHAFRRARAERLARTATQDARRDVVPARTVAVDESGDAPIVEAAAVEDAVVPEAEAATSGEEIVDVKEVGEEIVDAKENSDAEATTSTIGTMTNAAETASTEETTDSEAVTPTSDEDFEPVRDAADTTVEDAEPEPDSEPDMVPIAVTADWDKARVLTRAPFGGEVAWLAEYALLAVGRLQLGVLLGSSAADAVVRAARQRGMLDRHVVMALEVLASVFDALKKLELRPEHFFERPAKALVGVTPRVYLAARPLVWSESRLAIRDALREFIDARTECDESVPDSDDVSVPEKPRTDTGESPKPSPPATADQLPSKARAQHEAELARLAQEYERRLAEERTAADERLAAAREEAERRLDALEEELLHRADRAWERRERHMRRQTEERVALLRQEHQEAYRAVLRRAEEAEEAARRADGAEKRVHALERRLREYREGAEERIADLESRLWRARTEATERERTAEARIAEVEARLREAEAAVEQRDLLVEAARRHAEDAEQRAARRIAQTEHDARLRITELQTQLSDLQAQLAAMQKAARSRTSLRDRWRRF